MTKSPEMVVILHIHGGEYGDYTLIGPVDISNPRIAEAVDKWVENRRYGALGGKIHVCNIPSDDSVRLLEQVAELEEEL